MNYAGFFTRFIALVLDSILASILACLVSFLVSPLIGLTAGTDSGVLNLISGTLSFLLIVVLMLFQFFYFGYFWSKNGQSLGMKLVNVKVVRRSEGEPLSFLRAGLRGSVGYWISGLVFGLGYIWAAFDSNKEAWHDKIFDTWVVQV